MNEAKPNEMFMGLVLSLQASAWIHLGKVTNPVTGQVERNLPAAHETIDLLGMLEEKTRGNLVEEEQKLLTGLLMDLRLNYAEEVRKGETTAEEKDTPSAAGERQKEPADAETGSPPPGQAG